MKRAAMCQRRARSLEAPIAETPQQQLRRVAAAVANDQAQVVAVKMVRVVWEGRLDARGIVVANAAVERLARGAAAMKANLLAVGEPVLVAHHLARGAGPDLPGA